ncbi:MAG: hypothetical protein ACRDOK_27585 [Streptosporangiaceae bacterium]
MTAAISCERRCWADCNAAAGYQLRVGRRLGEAAVDVERKFQREQGTGGVDPVLTAAGEAGQDVVDHRLVRADGG